MHSSSVGGASQEDRGPKKSKLEKIAEMQAARNAALAKSGRGRAKLGGDELDPMDPVSVCGCVCVEGGRGWCVRARQCSICDCCGTHVLMQPVCVQSGMY